MTMKPVGMMTQNMTDPRGLESKTPRFSYLLPLGHRGERQTAYQILAASQRELLEEGKADLWDSGKVMEERNYGLPYAGKTLTSRQEVFWKVRVWDEQDQASSFSECARFEMGLLEEDDWRGIWIGQGDDFDGDKSAAPAFRTGFGLQEKNTVKRGRLYISGLGLFQASINGRSVSDHLFEPGESEFNRRVYYVTYDVTDLLQEGENVLGVVLGNGQYVNFAVSPVMKMGDGSLCGKHRYQKDDTIFLKNGICGDKKLIAQVEVTRKDGSVELLAASGESWEMGESPITFQNWYGGEDFDGKKALEMKGWDMSGYDSLGWERAKEMKPPLGKLSAKEFLPIRIWERWQAKSVTRLPGGNYLVDMGKNSAGFVRLKLENTKGLAGEKIELYPAEVLKSDGSGVDQASCTQSCDRLWQCSVKDCYTVAGTGREEWHPVFCYHGFQYVEVAGFPGIPAAENFEGCAVRLMNEKYSDFETDNEILNRINQITDRSIESNMMCSFTDCPQIEKLGWLETTQLMFSSMAAGYDIRSWIPKIMRDMQDAQITRELAEAEPMEADSRKYPGFAFCRFPNRETEEAGFVPGIAPEYFRIGRLYKDPNWGGACIMTPWYYYLEYGDESILQENFGMMKAYIEHLYRQSAGGVLKDYAHMGEWGQLHEETPTTLVATCAFYLLAVSLAKISGVLGKGDEQAHYQKMTERIREGFYQDRECWQEETGTCGNGSQASYGCALFSGIARPGERQALIDKLLKAVAQKDYHLNSGEVGLKQVFCALASGGKNDTVYRMIMNPTAPSYRHHIDQGLTTLPEFWNYTELWNGLGRSRNHAMMGHVKEWLCRYVMGITPLAPGYSRLQIRPYLQEEIHEVKGSIFTVRGRVGMECVRSKDTLVLKAEIPTGAKADIYLPWSGAGECCLDKKPFSQAISMPDGYLKIADVPAGCYEWTVRNR